MNDYLEEAVPVGESNGFDDAAIRGESFDYPYAKCDSDDENDCAPARTLTIEVKMPGNAGKNSLTLSEIDPTMNVRALKCLIYNRLLERSSSSCASVPNVASKITSEPVPAERQRLIFSGKMLTRDDDTLEDDIKLKVGSTNFIHLVPIPLGKKASKRKKCENKGPGSRRTPMRRHSDNILPSTTHTSRQSPSATSLTYNSVRSAATARQTRARFASELASISSPAARLSGTAHAQHLLQRLSNAEEIAEALVEQSNPVLDQLSSASSGPAIAHIHHHYEPTVMTRQCVSMPSLHNSIDVASGIDLALASQHQTSLANSVFTPVYPVATTVSSNPVTNHALGTSSIPQDPLIYTVVPNLLSNTAFLQEGRQTYTTPVGEDLLQQRTYQTQVAGINGAMLVSLENISHMAQQLRPLHEEVDPALYRVQMLFNEEMEYVRGSVRRTAEEQEMTRTELQNIADSLDRHAAETEALASALRSAQDFFQ